jgi:hypothetical protein
VSREQKTVVAEIVESALRELSDAEYQHRVWLGSGVSEVSSMTEATAALFDDSGLDQALEKNQVTFSPEIDNDLRKLRMRLRFCLRAELERGTASAISSPDWQAVREIATGILAVLGRKH